MKKFHLTECRAQQDASQLVIASNESYGLSDLEPLPFSRETPMASDPESDAVFHGEEIGEFLDGILKQDEMASEEHLTNPPATMCTSYLLSFFGVFNPKEMDGVEKFKLDAASVEFLL
jgi:hypothetical protein